MPPRTAICVAVSGGLDSVVLLDLLQALSARWGWSLTAAHFDHRMRPRSTAEARWVRELCARRGVECRVGRAAWVPGNEAEAREARYEFLLRARLELRAALLATAHQADDQAETVLFRLLRGAGLRGVSGIPASRTPGIVRPLLPFWREELAGFAEARGLGYLADPSNRDLRIARNRIRHLVIPFLESTETPGLRQELHRLGTLAGRIVEEVDDRVEAALEEMVIEETEDRVVVARTPLLAYDSDVRAHLLRALVARAGSRPGRGGTRTALQFITSASSGRGIDLAGGTRLRREFDRLVVERSQPRQSPGDGELVVDDVGAGTAVLEIGGVGWHVSWASDGRLATGEERLQGDFDIETLEFPIMVRGWRPGDRIRLPAGSRKLKRVFSDRKVPLSERARYPVVADLSGVLWVVGLVRGSRGRAKSEGPRLTVSFRRPE